MKFDNIIESYLLKEEDDRPHYQLILRIEASNLPNSAEECTKLIQDLADTINMKIVYGPKSMYLDTPGTEGYSAFAIITSSHISVRIWDKTQPPLMQIDIFSCNSFSKKDVERFLHNRFDINDIKDIFIDRTRAIKVKE